MPACAAARDVVAQAWEFKDGRISPHGQSTIDVIPIAWTLTTPWASISMLTPSNSRSARRAARLAWPRKRSNLARWCPRSVNPVARGSCVCCGARACAAPHGPPELRHELGERQLDRRQPDLERGGFGELVVPVDAAIGLLVGELAAPSVAVAVLGLRDRELLAVLEDPPVVVGGDCVVDTVAEGTSLPTAACALRAGNVACSPPVRCPRAAVLGLVTGWHVRQISAAREREPSEGPGGATSRRSTKVRSEVDGEVRGLSAISQCGPLRSRPRRAGWRV